METDNQEYSTRTWAGKVLKQMGWKVIGEFPDIKKSIVIFAPHTAHIDALYGKLGITEVGIKFKFLSKKELFFFPMNLVMKKFGSVPVRGVKGQNAIFIKQMDYAHSPAIIPLVHGVFWREYVNARERAVLGMQSPFDALAQAEKQVQFELDKAKSYDLYVQKILK